MISVRDAVDEYVAHLQTLTENKVEVKPGRKFIKVVFVGQWQTFVHSFVDAKTGDLLKAESYRKPAKHVRYNLLRQMDTVKKVADHYGGYLYLDRIKNDT